MYKNRAAGGTAVVLSYSCISFSLTTGVVSYIYILAKPERLFCGLHYFVLANPDQNVCLSPFETNILCIQLIKDIREIIMKGLFYEFKNVHIGSDLTSSTISVS